MLLSDVLSSQQVFPYPDVVLEPTHPSPETGEACEARHMRPLCLGTKRC